MSSCVQLKVTLAPCIEGLILLDRLCYLQEQVTSFQAVLKKPKYTLVLSVRISE